MGTVVEAQGRAHALMRCVCDCGAHAYTSVDSLVVEFLTVHALVCGGVASAYPAPRVDALCGPAVV